MPRSRAQKGEMKRRRQEENDKAGLQLQPRSSAKDDGGFAPQIYLYIVIFHFFCLSNSLVKQVLDEQKIKVPQKQERQMWFRHILHFRCSSNILPSRSAELKNGFLTKLFNKNYSNCVQTIKYDHFKTTLQVHIQSTQNNTVKHLKIRNEG